MFSTIMPSGKEKKILKKYWKRLMNEIEELIKENRICKNIKLV